jgi:transcriptional regulator with XRE-family HTH domain
MSAEVQRKQLADFLKGCRARLTPSDLGLPDSSRRRTPGLRREDVAALAGVSVTWYTWLEQGRDIRVSDDVLEKISTTLRMTKTEREFLFSLVQHRPAPLVEPLDGHVSEALSRMIEALHVPALVMTLGWDVMAWNPIMSAVFSDYETMVPGERNLLQHLLTDERYQEDLDEYRKIARRIIAKFRIDYSHAPEDPAMNELIAELSEACEVFAEIWAESEVADRSHGINSWSHPKLGGITFEHTSYIPEGSPDLRLVIFIPENKASRSKLAALARDAVA